MLSGESSQELLHPGVWELFKGFTPTDFPDVINLFKREYAFLANTFKCQLTYQERQFKCARDAYAYFKPADQEDLALMQAIVEAKFAQNPDLMQRLEETKGCILINGNSKKETFWGVDLYSWAGENHLGEILMTLRDKEV